MKRKIRKVAVLGAGVMGSGIAALLANTRTPCLLLDIVPPNLGETERQIKAKRDMFAVSAVDKALKTRQPMCPFYAPEFARYVETGNLEDDLHRLADCDWVIEVVVENMDIKRSLFAKLEQICRPDCIISSNTSGLSIQGMTEGRGDAFKQHFLVTHFFNPVRHMRLLEFVVGPSTLPEVVETVATFGADVLGKGVVYGKDTPNFVANRIGVHAMMATIHQMTTDGLTVEEVDELVGTPVGRPKSAAFRTADLVGLDTFAHVARTCLESPAADEDRDVFQVPEWLQKMVQNGWLGNKTKQGFYKKTGSGADKAYFQINPTTLEYVPTARPKLAPAKATKGVEEPAKRIRKALAVDDKYGQFLWKLMARSLVYAANRVGEIADDIVNIDNAMKWGFNWELGPFETWDALGLADSIPKIEALGFKVPAWVKQVLTAGYGSFYLDLKGQRYFWDKETKSYRPIAQDKRNICLKTLHDDGRVLQSNTSASLVDLGDGVLGIEFHSKMNAIDDDIVRMMWEGIHLAEDKYKAIVIANQGKNFSVGANLLLLLMYAQQKEWAPIEQIVKAFQEVNKAMRYCAVPVVAAPFQMVLGGGCEVCLPCDRIVANAETYMGLVEVGVGLIPGGGGCKEMVMRTVGAVPKDVKMDRFALVQKAFMAIGMAKVAMSGDEARGIGFLRPFDVVQTNRDIQIAEAKRVAIGLADMGYQPPLEPDNLIMPGRTGWATAKLGLYQMKLGGAISDHDELIGRKLAYVLCGGDVDEGTVVTEDRLLELEREVFMSLIGEEKSQARMQHMLMTNKPLRN